MSTAARSLRRRLVAASVGLGLAAVAVFAVVALARRESASPRRDAPGDVVLEATVSLDDGAVDRRLLAPGPCVFDVEVTTFVPVAVTFGPPEPSTADAEGGPAPETSTGVSDVVSGTIRGTVRVCAAGIQVVRVRPMWPFRRADGSTARILVRRRSGS